MECFDFSNGFKCSNVHKFEKVNILSINILEINFYQDRNKWEQKLNPIEYGKNDESNSGVDLIIYKNHYALIEKLNVFLGDHHKNFICRRSLKSYTSETMLMIHKPKCETYDITTIRTSSESHIQWKKHFHKNPLYFRLYGDYEADNEIDNSSIGIKTTNIYKQNPLLNGYPIESEINDVSKNGNYEPPSGYDNVDWFVNEVIKLENKTFFYLKITKKDIITTDEDEELH